MESEKEADQLVHQLSVNWRLAPLSAENQALCDFAEKLTKTPQTMTQADIGALRSCGYDDRAIHDATQVISYFNYINRVADALDVDLEEGIHPWESSLP